MVVNLCRARANPVACRDGSWNAGPCCGQAVAQATDDVAFVTAVLLDVIAQGVVMDGTAISVAGEQLCGYMCMAMCTYAMIVPGDWSDVSSPRGTICRHVCPALGL